MPRPNKAERRVVLDYTNYRGERSLRTVIPRAIEFNSTEYHTEPQWLLVAFDEDRQAVRYFAIADIHEWRAFPGGL